MGNNLLVIQAGSSSTGGVRGGAGTQPHALVDDLTAIRDEVPSVKRAAPYLRSSQTILGDDQNWATSVIGTSPEYFDIRTWPASSGRIDHRQRHHRKHQGRRLGPDRRRQFVRTERQRRRPNGAHQQHAVRGHRRRVAQRAIDDRTGLRRHRVRAQKNPRRLRRFYRAKSTSKRKRRTPSRARSPTSPRSSAIVTSCSPTTTTTSKSAHGRNRERETGRHRHHDDTARERRSGFTFGRRHSAS